MKRYRKLVLTPTRLLYMTCVVTCTSVFLYLGMSMEGLPGHRLVSNLLVNTSSTTSFRPFPLHFPITDDGQDNSMTTTVRKYVGQGYSHGASENVPPKKTNAVFLKVHKAGSTTIMNIFLRFGISNRLNIVLPNREDGNGFNYLGYGKTVDKNEIVPVPHNETYNILCNHVVYNRHAFRAIMPVDTVYVGIVREPVSHFLSASVYYQFIHMIKEVSGLFNQSSPTEVIHEYFTHQDKYSHIRTLFVRNRMSYDFGLPPSLFEDNVYVENFISDLATDFKLVMVMEYFPESLVLLKRYLGWGLDDILYVPLNINEFNSRKHVSLFPADTSKLKKWNYADFRLYDFFKRRFQTQVQAEGPSFQNEVQHFKKVQLYVKSFCSAYQQSKQLTIHASQWNEEFYLLADNCRIMTMQEIPLLQMLIQHAKHKYNKSKVDTGNKTLSAKRRKFDIRHTSSVGQTHTAKRNKPWLVRKQEWENTKVRIRDKQQWKNKQTEVRDKQQWKNTQTEVRDKQQWQNTQTEVRDKQQWKNKQTEVRDKQQWKNTQTEVRDKQQLKNTQTEVRDKQQLKNTQTEVRDKQQWKNTQTEVRDKQQWKNTQTEVRDKQQWKNTQTEVRDKQQWKNTQTEVRDKQQWKNKQTEVRDKQQWKNTQTEVRDKQQWKNKQTEVRDKQQWKNTQTEVRDKQQLKNTQTEVRDKQQWKNTQTEVRDKQQLKNTQTEVRDKQQWKNKQTEVRDKQQWKNTQTEVRDKQQWKNKQTEIRDKQQWKNTQTEVRDKQQLKNTQTEVRDKQQLKNTQTEVRDKQQWKNTQTKVRDKQQWRNAQTQYINITNRAKGLTQREKL